MCGIAGAIGALDATVIAAVRRASAAEAHRGPDAEGLWKSSDDSGPGVVLAHRRLSILDLSADGTQPMHDPKSGVVIVYNGEVYNFAALRRELEAGGASFHSKTDTEVLLHAYVRWGPEFVSRLRGMFGFALYDPRTRRLLIARDRLGIKPVYVARLRRPAGDLLFFASEVRALLATGLVEPRLDPIGLQTQLWHGFPVGPGTLVRGVRRLEAGTSLTIDLDDDLRETSHRYWTLPGASGASSDVSRLREELEASVRMRLVADVPLGVFLSGGIDSSAISALAMRGGDHAIRTFNVGFEESRYDESQHARAVARALGTEHQEIRLSQASFTGRLGDALAALDQPTFDAINTWFVSRAVRDAGITVALAGTGGDELFGGYASFRELPRLALLSRAAQLLPGSARRAIGAAITRGAFGRAGETPPQMAWAKLGEMLGARGRLLDLYQLSYALFLPGFLRQLAPGLEWSQTRAGLPLERADELDAAIAGSPTLHAVSMLELASFIGERLLPDTDAASMAVSLEVRVPLLDHRVVETLAGIDPARRFAPLGRKQLLRDLALADLDPKLFERPKQGFELPIGGWIRQELRAEIDALLTDRAACAAVGLDGDAVARLWRAYAAGAPGIYWSRPWSLFVLLWWCRRYGVAI
ncbi:MAG: asparagine synthase (glutamine-hydrolyzing) [Myxococcota bacterium]|nr:asparagine synthase (glutamine-hydrolyzing) [Myxococcota bacterium]